jgi:hypothetical protein
MSNSKFAALPGFFTSAWIVEKGLYLTIENLSKLISTQTCLDIIKEYCDEGKNEEFINT